MAGGGRLGGRTGKLVGSTWKEVELGADCPVWHSTKGRGKTGTSISVPLPDAAVKWFEELKVRAFGSEFVFPNRREAKGLGTSVQIPLMQLLGNHLEKANY